MVWIYRNSVHLFQLLLAFFLIFTGSPSPSNNTSNHWSHDLSGGGGAGVPQSQVGEWGTPPRVGQVTGGLPRLFFFKFNFKSDRSPQPELYLNVEHNKPTSTNLQVLLYLFLPNQVEAPHPPEAVQSDLMFLFFS